jgi:hypothetical protein
VPNGDVKVSYAKVQFVASGGSGSYTFALFAPGTLPPGLTLSSSGSLSGTPNQSGTYTFGVRATDTASPTCSGGRSYTMTINCPTPPGIDPPVMPAGTVNATYHVDLTGTNGTPPYTFSLVAGGGNLPPGVSLVGSAIDGTPTTEGSYFFTLKVAESNGCFANYSYKIVVSCPTIVLTPPNSATLSDATVNEPYGPVQITATPPGKTYTYTVTSGAPPTGITVSPSGEISGTPTGSAPAEWTFTVTATDPHGCTGDATYTIAVVCPTITLSPNGGSLGGATVNEPFGPVQITATPVGKTYTYDLVGGTLPPGITLSSSGLISGTPTGSAPQPYTFTVRATDPHGCTAVVTYTINVVCPTITFTPTDGSTLPPTTLNDPYDSGPITPGPAGKTYTFSDLGSLPSGLHLSTTSGSSTSIVGTADGTPHSRTVTIHVEDPHGCTGDVSYTMNVVCPTITFTPTGGSTLPDATLNDPYDSGPITVAPARKTYTFSDGGSLPSGLHLEAINGGSAHIVGTADGTPHTRTVTIHVGDPHGCTGDVSYTMNVVCPTVLLNPTSGTLSDATVNEPYGPVQISATPLGKTYTYTVTSGAPPAGITVSPSGEISGTPNGLAPLTSTFTVTAADPHGCTGDVTYTIHVVCPTITFVPTFGTLDDATVNVAYPPRTVTPSPTGKTYDFTISSGSLPQGMTMSPASGSSTTISGTPDGVAPLASTFTITATDPHGCTADVTYTINVKCPTITFSPTAGTLDDATVNVAYPPRTVTPSPSGKTYDFTISSGSLPHGMTMSPSSGPSTTISGTPDGLAPSTSTFTVTATDPHGCSADVTYTIHVLCPTITFAPTGGTLDDATVNVAYPPRTVTPSPTGKTYDFTISSGSLPQGMTMSPASGSSTTISGTPNGSAPLASTFTITATDPHGCTGDVTYTINVVCPTITFAPAGGSLPDATVNESYDSGSLTPSPTGKTYAFTSTPLPSGLTLNGGPGTTTSITGTPDGSAPNPVTVTVTATDTHGCSGSATYTFDINCPTVTMTPPSGPLPGAAVNQPYDSGALTPAPGGKNYTFTVSAGSLPPGLSFTPPSGSETHITGTPTGPPGTSNFTVHAEDPHGCSVENAYSITVFCGSVVAVTPSSCISTGSCTTIPIEIHRCNNSSVLLFHVKFTLSPELTTCDPCASGNSATCPSIVEGDFFGGSATIFAIANNGGGQYEVDASMVPCPPGSQAVDATLFTVSVKGTGAGGPTGTLTLNEVTIRDCSNADIPTNAGPPITLTISGTPPGPPTGLTAVQKGRDGDGFINDTDGTTKVQLSFSAPGATAVKVYRAPFGHTGATSDYPEYDDVGGHLPTKPTTYPPPPEWTVTTVAASGDMDETTERGFWYYVAYSQDACGNFSAASDTTPGVLNYHLGDSHNGITNCVGNNAVGTEDVTHLYANYGATLAHASDARACIDVGPTTNHTARGRPRTDDRINFEDLAIYSINFHVVHGPNEPQRALADRSSSNRLQLTVPSKPAIGQTFTVTLDMAGAGDIHALSAWLDWDRAVVEPVAVDAGELVSRQAVKAVVLSSEPGDVDIATLGVEAPGLQGSGVVAQVTFRVKSEGDAAISLKRVDARNDRNETVDLERGETTFQAPAHTFLTAGFPNPFRESIRVRFGLRSAGVVKMAVFDLQGRMVRNLFNGYHPAGEKTVSWDGRGGTGAEMAAGLYMIRLEAEGRVFTQRIAMVR